MKYNYEKTIKLKHNEVPAKINKDTAEVITLEKPNNVPEGKIVFKQTDFSKLNTQAIHFLFDNCSRLEIAVVLKMVAMAEYGTNSLKPLSNETTVRDLAETFGFAVGKVQQTFKHLFKLGVYAQFKVCKGDLKEYWILNPYIACKGRVLDNMLTNNFKGTDVEKYVTKYSPK